MIQRRLLSFITLIAITASCVFNFCRLDVVADEVSEQLNLENYEYSYPNVMDNEADVTTTASGKAKLLLYYNPGCWNCSNMTMQITEDEQFCSAVDVCIIVINSNQNNTLSIAQQYDNYSRVKWGYSSDNSDMWSYVCLISDSYSITTPATVYIDENNVIQDIRTGYLNLSDIKAILGDCCSVTNPNIGEPTVTPLVVTEFTNVSDANSMVSTNANGKPKLVVFYNNLDCFNTYLSLAFISQDDELCDAVDVVVIIDTTDSATANKIMSYFAFKNNVQWGYGDSFDTMWYYANLQGEINTLPTPLCVFVDADNSVRMISFGYIDSDDVREIFTDCCSVEFSDIMPTAIPIATDTPTPVITDTPTSVPTEEPTSTPVVIPSTVPTYAPIIITDTPVQVLSGVEGFAARLYTCALNRAYDEAGKDYWANALRHGTTGADAARGFLFSEEVANANITDAEFIGRLYATLMDRAPAPEEVSYWVGTISEGGSRESVFAGFIHSQEWANVCLSYGILSGGSGVPSISVEASDEIVAFATRLYTTCLGREADQAGLEWWANELANLRVTGSSAAESYFFSDEFVNAGVGDREFVNRLYLTFMDRNAAEGEFSYWLGEMAGGMSRETVFAGFAGSEEFGNICAEFGIIR